MLQVEIRANGMLIDYMNIINEGPARAGLAPGVEHTYRVEHGGSIQRLIHNRKDGALALVEKALAHISLAKNCVPKASI